MRNYRKLLQDVPTWDQVAYHLYRIKGHPDNRLLQNREEMIRLCEWIETHQIRSFLEIGIWTGYLVRTLHQLFEFETVAICDLDMAGRNFGYEVQVPPDTRCFWGSSHSEEYKIWRENLGHIDLVMIDGDHNYPSVRRDFEINRQYPSHYLAFHDICNTDPVVRGVQRLWTELKGDKTTICLPFQEESLEHYRMGIGIVRTETAVLEDANAGMA